MAHDIFISYSHHDKPTADAIVAKFESEGLRCWYAPRDIAPGEDWAAAIIDGIKDSKVFVVVFTSYSNGSQQVLREIGLAVTKGMPIIPFKITNTEPSKGMQYYLSTVHWLDAVDGQFYHCLAHGLFQDGLKLFVFFRHQLCDFFICFFQAFH